jgi:hypothetical protein
VSRVRLQSELRICKECLVNRVRDASLEAAHRLPARSAWGKYSHSAPVPRKDRDFRPELFENETSAD